MMICIALGLSLENELLLYFSKSHYSIFHCFILITLYTKCKCFRKSSKINEGLIEMIILANIILRGFKYSLCTT